MLIQNDNRNGLPRSLAEALEHHFESYEPEDQAEETQEKVEKLEVAVTNLILYMNKNLGVGLCEINSILETNFKEF